MPASRVRTRPVGHACDGAADLAALLAAQSPTISLSRPDGRPGLVGTVKAEDALIALHRYGLGPKPDVSPRASDATEMLLGDLRPERAVLRRDHLLSTSETGTALERRRASVKTLKAAGAARAPDGDGTSSAAPSAARPTLEGQAPSELLVDEAEARFEAASAAEIGFVERLVWFWSNHLCISASKSRLRALAGPFEREAIRPYVLGRFSDMLLAAESHPAMLAYLDNVASIGPNSEVGLARGRGLNENLAREILELHTLGVGSGYTQEDVTTLAKALTGWAATSRANERGAAFEFDPRRHEPGPKRVLGKLYADAGVEQGRAILRDLARRPETARHVAGKLARHFVADDPPRPLVDALARRYRETDGDLKELAVTLVTYPGALGLPRAKLKRPSEWLAGCWRALGVEPDPARAMRLLAGLGEPLWRPPAPKGFPDVAAEWMDGLSGRLDVAGQLVDAAPTRDARSLLQATIGPLASAETRAALARADTPRQATVLLLMAPEMLRR